jgi:hypothetical protein
MRVIVWLIFVIVISFSFVPMCLVARGLLRVFLALPLKLWTKRDFYSIGCSRADVYGHVAEITG